MAISIPPRLHTQRLYPTSDVILLRHFLILSERNVSVLFLWRGSLPQRRRLAPFDLEAEVVLFAGQKGSEELFFLFNWSQLYGHRLSLLNGQLSLEITILLQGKYYFEGLLLFWKFESQLLILNLVLFAVSPIARSI